MKYILLILVVGLVAFMLGFKRSRPKPPVQSSATPKAPPPPAAQQDMVSCAHCGLHLPRDETLPGRGGLFCSAAHRAAFEASPPA
jgi:uncharacterized protein